MGPTSVFFFSFFFRSRNGDMIGLSGFGIFQFCRRFLPAQPSKRLHETSLVSSPVVKHLHRATSGEALASCACTDLRASCCIPRYACKPLRLRSELSWWRCRKITRARCLGRFRSSCMAGAKVTDKLFEMADRAMHDHCSFVSGASKTSLGEWALLLGMKACSRATAHGPQRAASSCLAQLVQYTCMQWTQSVAVLRFTVSPSCCFHPAARALRERTLARFAWHEVFQFVHGFRRYRYIKLRGQKQNAIAPAACH